MRRRGATHAQMRPNLLDVKHFQELGRIAERGKLDSVFFADGLAVGPRVKYNTQAIFEPVTLLSAIAAATDKVGLIATASTSYSDPYTLARKFASLDHISGGRGGWNIVTSAGADEAANFGLDCGTDAQRSLRARRGVSRRDARTLGQAGKRGQLSWTKRPESSPILIVSIASTMTVNDSRWLARSISPRSPTGDVRCLYRPVPPRAVRISAARYAEAVFTAQRTLEQGQDFYTDLKARLIKYGRSPDEIKVLPGIVPFIADTEEEAKALEQSFTDLISPEYSLRQLSNMVGVDLTEHSLDAPLPPFAGHRSRPRKQESIPARQRPCGERKPHRP